MKNSSPENGFLQPIISTVGLIVSIITAILPIFSKGFIVTFFIDERLASPISFVALVLGIAIVWQIMQEPFIVMNIGKLKNRGNQYPEYLLHLEARGITWVLVVFAGVVSILFLFLGLYTYGGWTSAIATCQTLLYLSFFLSIIAIFGILLAQTKQRFKWDQDKENFPTLLLETLQRNGLVKSGIEIIENMQVNPNDAIQELGLSIPVPARKIKVRTVSQEEEIIEFFTSYDGKEILKAKK